MKREFVLSLSLIAFFSFLLLCLFSGMVLRGKHKHLAREQGMLVLSILDALDRSHQDVAEVLKRTLNKHTVISYVVIRDKKGGLLHATPDAPLHHTYRDVMKVEPIGGNLFARETTYGEEVFLSYGKEEIRIGLKGAWDHLLHMQSFLVSVASIFLGLAGISVCFYVLSTRTFKKEVALFNIRFAQLAKNDRAVPPLSLDSLSFLRSMGKRFNDMNGALERRQIMLQQEVEKHVKRFRKEETRVQFMANMQHRIRGPLRMMMGFSEKVSQEAFGELNSRYKDYAQEMMEAGYSLLQAMEDVTALVEIESGHYIPQMDQIDIYSVIEKAVSSARSLPNADNLGIFYRQNHDMLTLEGDQRILFQSLMILLSNAVKYTPDKGFITVQAHEENGWVSVSVRDTGRGMSKEESDAYQNPLLDQSFKGNGIGIILLRRLLSLHQGGLTVESLKGSGSTITLIFPLAQNKTGVA